MDGKKLSYNKFALVREMLETPRIIREFRSGSLEKPLKALKKTGKLFLAGEGSSRIFPAKNAVFSSLREGASLTLHTEGSRQAAELNLRDYVLFGASNSGKTNELISLFKGKKAFSKFILTENKSSILGKLSEEAFILNCGKEEAVAATKSVIEEGLFFRNLLLQFSGRGIPNNVLSELSKKAENVLNMGIDGKIIAKITRSPVLYFAGRNDGVAEEAALKANEIIRKKSVYLEGTYAVHGIEEVMEKKEAAVLIEPFKEEELKLKKVLADGVGMDVIAISSRKTIFPTIRIPSMKGYEGYLHLLACWNLLVESGIKLNINLDMTKRARKIGNEYIPVKAA